MSVQNTEVDDENTIAVVWYDGNQRCKVFNVQPLQSAPSTNDTPCALHGITADQNAHPDTSIDTIINNDMNGDNKDSSNKSAIGIDNAGFHHTNDDTPSYSKADHLHPTILERSNSNTKVSSCDTCKCNLSSSSDGAHTNPVFYPCELTFGTDRKYDEIKCTCPDGLNQTHQGSERAVSSNELSSSGGITNSIDNDTNATHVGKQNLDEPPSLDGVVVCNVCHNEIPLTSSTPVAEVEVVTEEPPPHYSTLRYLFLADEPPKYQDVTGKALTSATIPVRHRLLSEPAKRRIVIGCVVVFFLLIGALLVYACFVSGHPLGSYGAAPRKF